MHFLINHFKMKNKFLLIAIITLCILSCSKGKTIMNREDLAIDKTFKIDPTIKKDTAFKFLNTLPETYNFLDEVMPNAKKSSNVHFNYGKDVEATEHYYSVRNKADAFKKGNDSLIISIGTADGYSGSGINLMIKKDSYSSRYYKFSDMLSYDDKKPQHKTLYQNLILDKAKYNLNDSIYGFINFKSQYIDERSDTIIVAAKGHFRAKVVKGEF